MTKTQQATQAKPLDLEHITQPFDLATALTYMRENGEFVRGVDHDGQAFYLYLEHKTVPVVVKGRRRFETFEAISGVTQWGGAVTNLPLSALTGDQFHIMLFDEVGEPIWHHPEPVTEREGDNG